MPSRKYMANGLPSSRTPSPPDSFESTSSTSTYYSATSNPSPPSSPASSKPILIPPSMYSTNPPKPRRISPPQTVLGAIDENSGAVQPDVPLSANKEASPITKLHAYASAPNCRKKPTIASASSPPRSEFDFLIGPNGERFTDLRMNRKLDAAKTRGVLKRLMTQQGMRFINAYETFLSKHLAALALWLDKSTRTNPHGKCLESIFGTNNTYDGTRDKTANGGTFTRL